MNYALVTPQKYALISFPSNKTTLRNSMVAAFIAVGWTNTSITGGSELSSVTPQGYALKLDITVGPGDYLIIQFKSVSGGTDGLAHRLAWNSTFVYQILVNPTGFFISRPSVTYDVNGSAVCGGGLYAPQDCGLSALIGPITELWWSMGDWYGSPFFYGENPRVNLDIQGAIAIPECGNFNGTLVIGDNSRPIGMPRILELASPDVTTIITVPPINYNGSDFLYEAFVAWGETSSDPLRIRGQIYNAAIRSGTYPMDETSSWDGYTWMNYTDNYPVGSLWLLRGSSPRTKGNYAY